MTGRTRLNYLNDTLLDPIAKTVDCDVLITLITPGALQVQVLFRQCQMIYTRLIP
ncbi:hypothetical protein [Pseudomonas syringae]|uniref:hypothetical protein n=1 Tax=Pseudomonas syringae TaxID=317 RepID=UPI00147B1C82|nr:hypothetical protein [Pseudomonas syringae]